MRLILIGLSSTKKPKRMKGSEALMLRDEDEFCRSRKSISTNQLMQIMGRVKTHEYASWHIRSVCFGGQQWVVFSDVCKVLGYKNPRHQRKKIPSNEQHKLEIGLKNTLATCINGSGFRRYIATSEKAVEPFANWVLSEIFKAGTGSTEA